MSQETKVYICEFCGGKVTTDLVGNQLQGCCKAQARKRWQDYQDKIKAHKRPYIRKKGKWAPETSEKDSSDKQQFSGEQDNPPHDAEKETK